MTDNVDTAVINLLSEDAESKFKRKSKATHARQAHRKPTVNGIVVGLVADVKDQRPWVDFSGNPAGAPVAVLVVANHDEWEVGQEVALMFQDGDLNRPIAVGPIERLVEDDVSIGRSNGKARAVGTPGARQVAEQSMLVATKQLTLRCGKASITLTKSGKIILRGKYILSRSEGVNRIKGGSVQIN